MKNSQKKLNIKSLLISTPWAAHRFPNIQIGLLKAYANKHSLCTDVAYWNLDVANALGETNYDKLCALAISVRIQMLSMSDNIYSRILFPELLQSKQHHKTLLEMFRKCDLSESDFYSYLSSIKAISSKLLRSIRWDTYACVGFTVAPYQLMASLYFAKEIKRRSPGTKIIFGGYRCHEGQGRSLFEIFDFIDYLVPGEGERPFVRILKHLSNPNSRSNKIRGVWSRRDSSIIWGGDDKRINNLDTLPFPDFDAYFDKLSKCKNLDPEPGLLVETSRGCSWERCRFCAEAKIANYRYHSLPYVERMVTYLTKRHKILEFFFCDNEFPADELYGPKLKREPIYLGNIQAMLRSTVSKSTLINLKKAGINRVLFGLESYSDRGLRQICKGTRVIDNLQVCKWSKELGLMLQSNYLINYPQMNIPDFEETLYWIANMPYKGFSHYFSIYFLRYGSEYFRNPSKYGITILGLHPYERDLFPKEIADKIVGYTYDYKFDEKQKLFTDSDTVSKHFASFSLELFKHELFYVDNGAILIIYKTNPFFKLPLKDRVRELYIYCDTHRSLNDILKKFSDLGQIEIRRLLKGWISEGLMVEMAGRHMSLAYRLLGAFVQ